MSREIVDEAITGFPFSTSTAEDFPDRRGKTLSLSRSVAFFPPPLPYSRARTVRVSDRVSQLIDIITRCHSRYVGRYRFRITLADQWRNLIGGSRNSQFNSSQPLQTLDVPEKKLPLLSSSPLWNALAESRGYPASVVPIKITRGKNLSIKPIATCKDRSSVTLRDHTRTHTHERTHIHARSLPSFRVMIFNRRQHRRVAVPFLAREGRGGKKRSILFHSC